MDKAVAAFLLVILLIFVLGAIFSLALRTREQQRSALPDAEFASTYRASDVAPRSPRAEIVLGRAGASRELIFYTGESHLLTVGSTRSGKGVGAIIPNLLHYKGSILVIDPKGENTKATINERRSLGQKIVVIDPWNVTGYSSVGQATSYNPLALSGRDAELIVEDAALIADALVVPSGSSHHIFFEEEARSLLSCLCMYLMTAEWGSLGRLREIIAQPEDELIAFLRTFRRSSTFDGSMARGAEQFIRKANNERSGVLSTARQQTTFLDSASLVSSLVSSQFRFAQMRDEPTTVYFVIPIWRLATYGRWLRIIVSMAITELARATSAAKVPVLFVLDEFPALGPLKAFDTAFGIMAGLGVQLWPIIQDFSQLERMYGVGWQTFVANAGVLQSFGTRDLLTADYLSRRLGIRAETIEEISRSYGSNFIQATSTRTLTLPLMYSDQIIRMSAEQGLLFIENSDPIKFDKIKYFEEPRGANLFVSLRGRASTSI